MTAGAEPGLWSIYGFVPGNLWHPLKAFDLSKDAAVFDIFLLENRSDHEETGKIRSRILESVDALQEQKGLRPRWTQTYQRSEEIPSLSIFTPL